MSFLVSGSKADSLNQGNSEKRPRFKNREMDKDARHRRVWIAKRKKIAISKELISVDNLMFTIGNIVHNVLNFN